MAKENEYESTKRRESQSILGRPGTQDRQESGRRKTQPGRGEREAHRLPQRRGCAGDSPRFQPGAAHRGGKTQPVSRVHRAKPLQVAALSGWMWLHAGVGSHRQPVTNNPPPPPSIPNPPARPSPAPAPPPAHGATRPPTTSLPTPPPAPLPETEIVVDKNA